MNYNKADFIASYGISSQLPESDRPELSFSGRSNVGKSSLINKLCSRKNLARVSSTPGKTATINFYSVDDCYFVDLPGYGYAKVSKGERDRWGKLMESYFADRSQMTLGVMIVDSRHKPTADDCTMAKWYRDAGCPVVVVANKLDKLKKSEVEGNLQRIRETLELGEDTPLIPFSAEKGTGKEELLRIILASVKEV